MLLQKGADYGWPECYYDAVQKKLVLAPEYGGDGGKKVGVCADKTAPVAAFPGHWAPNDLLIYTGKAFPAAYHGGAFIAFHGSWNRAPQPQGGYNVVFQPLKDGKAAGDFHRLRRRFCRRDQGTGPGGVPPDRPRDGARRRALYFRRQARPDLAGHLSRRCRRADRAGAGAQTRRRERRRAWTAGRYSSRRRPFQHGLAADFLPAPPKSRSHLATGFSTARWPAAPVTGAMARTRAAVRRHRRW